MALVLKFGRNGLKSMAILGLMEPMVFSTLISYPQTKCPWVDSTWEKGDLFGQSQRKWKQDNMARVETLHVMAFPKIGRAHV